MSRILASLSLLLPLIACNGCRSDCCEDDSDAGDTCTDSTCDAACTAADQEVEGTLLSVTSVQLQQPPLAFPDPLLTSAADVAEAFPDGAPLEVMDTDFAVDRVVLGASNPVVRFAVDDGANLVVGEETLCQGAAPSGVAYVVHGTTRDSLEVHSCPYLGPDPCLAP